jgi:hypothetical protein
MEALQQRASERASERVALVGMCAPRNWPMRRIFEGAGLALHREDDEMHARGWVLPRQAASRVAARGLAS